MKTKSKLATVVGRIKSLPEWLHQPLLSFAIGNTVKFAGTAGISINSLSYDQCKITLKNRKKVQNHIGSVHAAATALLAESASGFVVGMNLPKQSLPLLKTMHVNYVKRSTGNLVATAILTEEQKQLLHTSPKGEVCIRVHVVDELGVEPVECEMIWAWIEKKAKITKP